MKKSGDWVPAHSHLSQVVYQDIVDRAGAGNSKIYFFATYSLEAGKLVPLINHPRSLAIKGVALTEMTISKVVEPGSIIQDAFPSSHPDSAAHE